jgi:hypothetical protein
MRNLYSITTNQAAIMALFRVVNRYVGNLPPMPGVFPDYPAPIIRNTGAERDSSRFRLSLSSGLPFPQLLKDHDCEDLRYTVKSYLLHRSSQYCLSSTSVVISA